MIKRALHDSGLPAHKLEVEITEGVLLDRARSVTTINALRELGVSVALDDFGTGYSSLSYLHELAVDKIKIDQSFVRQSSAEESRSIIMAIVGLAKAMNMEVTAEGVETTAQRDFLAEIGCNQLQGYLFSQPVPAPEFEKLLALSLVPENNSAAERAA